MTQLRARSLTAGEDRHLRKKEGSTLNFPGPLSILGPLNHSFVTSTIDSDTTQSHRVNLGGSDYIDETLGVSEIKDGHTTPELNFLEYSLQFLLASAKELKIHYHVRPNYIELIYFQSIYEGSFIEGVSYVSRELCNFERNRSLLDRWFGSSCKTNWESPEASSIRNGLSEIFCRFKHR